MGLLSIPAITESNSKNFPDKNFILGLEGVPLTYTYLQQQIKETVTFLNSIGIGRNDRVAIVLPNGPLMATAFLSVASGATSAPLNPAYTEAEYEFFIKDLDAKAIIVQKNIDTPVIQVADQLQLPIIEIAPKLDAPAGSFTCTTDCKQKKSSSEGTVKMSDIALILHTSGTTSRPKMVPLTHKNLCVSAGNIRNTLQLTPEDRCLNIMPLFHIHGLLAAVLATMLSGGTVVCTPGFFAPQFFNWLRNFKPTWYTAVPTMHQAILNRAAPHLNVINNTHLRFIRSSSSSLSPKTMEDLECIFHVPVIESYGMTEAAHQMASNPLPPGKRKAGSVGLPAGLEIAIMAENSPEILPVNSPGEIVIRGDNVTLGYLNNKEANEKSYTHGWFRTGDQGFLDKEGYLYISGRLKEIINRGGEKISPREIDEVLLTHPQVSQAVTFSIPDETLGEDIGAAIVLRTPDVNENDIKQFAAQRLVPYKVPSKVIILDEIPKGPTGKIQRIGLAKQLGLDKGKNRPSINEPSFEPSHDATEEKLCEIWESTLDIPQVGIHNRFRDVGGDSMLATLIQIEVENQFGISLSLIELYGASTVAEQAKLLDQKLSGKR